MSTAPTMKRRLIDIGANLTDKVFTGIYRNVQLHENDFQFVLSRAKVAGVERIVITGGSLEDSNNAASLAQTDEMLFCTVGCHPTRCCEFEPDPNKYLYELKCLIQKSLGKVVAVGECGLDYDREEFCPRSVQKKYFEYQLQLASQVDLPLFLHCRAAHEDLLDIISHAKKKYFTNSVLRGVVHTFDGNIDFATQIIDMGLFLGINGCSLKTEANLEVVKSIPLSSLLLETDAPWCEIRPTHAGFKYIKTHRTYRKHKSWEPSFMVKGRNEPANIVQVLEVVASLHGIDEDKVAEVIYQNTTDLFFKNA